MGNGLQVQLQESLVYQSSITNAGQVGMSAVNGVINWVKTLPGKVYNEFIKIGQKSWFSFKCSISCNKFWIWYCKCSNGSPHIASPGIIQRSIAKEFADIP